MIIIKPVLLNIIIMLFAAQVYTQPTEKTKYFSINCSEQPLRNILEEIRIQTGYNFIYNDNLVKNLKVTCNINKVKADDAVKKILSNYDISYKIFNENSYVLFKEKKRLEKTISTIEIEQNVPDIDTLQHITKPEMIFNITPIYPKDALKDNIEGDVTLKLLLDENGNISKSSIGKSSGFPVLDSAAIYQARNSRFYPVLVNGEPNRIWISIVFKYRIDKK